MHMLLAPILFMPKSKPEFYINLRTKSNQVTTVAC